MAQLYLRNNVQYHTVPAYGKQVPTAARLGGNSLSHNSGSQRAGTYCSVVKDLPKG